MVFKFLRNLFHKEEKEDDYKEISMEQINAAIKNKSVEKAPKQEEKPLKKVDMSSNDDEFTRYICGKCFKWSDFKAGTVPTSCPHCHNSDKSTFKKQRKY